MKRIFNILIPFTFIPLIFTEAALAKCVDEDGVYAGRCKAMSKYLCDTAQQNSMFGTEFASKMVEGVYANGKIEAIRGGMETGLVTRVFMNAGNQSRIDCLRYAPEFLSQFRGIKVVAKIIEKYVGDKKDGKRDGIGTYVWANGDNYSGGWKNNLLEGKGTYKWKDGMVYEGNFKNNLKHGYGILTWANGDRYEGNFKDDKFSGKGTYTFAKGHKYVGNYANNKKNGKGTFTWADGDKFVGNYKDDNRTGKGTLYYSNGSKFVGNYKNGERNGKGTFFDINGKKYNYVCIDNQCE